MFAPVAETTAFLFSLFERCLGLFKLELTNSLNPLIIQELS
jgi:hypothetical protein